MIIIFYDNFASFKKTKLTYKLILSKQKAGFDIESCLIMSLAFPNEIPFPAQFPTLSCLMGSMLANCPFLRIVFLGFHCP